MLTSINIYPRTFIPLLKSNSICAPLPLLIFRAFSFNISVQMSSSSLCDHLRLAHATAIKSVKGDLIIANAISFDRGWMKITLPDGVKQFDLRKKDVYLIGTGKGVLGLCLGFIKGLEKQKEDGDFIKITKGIISMPIGIKFGADQLERLSKHNIIPYFGAKNNLPDEDSVLATNAILDLIDSVIRDGQTLRKSTVFITLITGGASALLVAPKEPLTLKMKRDLTKALMAAGCTINELNCVRSCWSKVKAGQLAVRVLSSSSNVKMINLIASDVIGDPLDIIGSGPTVIRPDDSVKPLEILDFNKITIDQRVRDLCSKSVTPKVDNLADRLHNLIIVNNQIALTEVKNLMETLGYKVIDMGNQISGESSTLSSQFAQIARTSNKSEGKVCWIGGGETVVTLTPNHGKGGRCQEMALQFLIDTYNDKLTNFAFLAGGTDGQDGPTPISGIIYQYSDSISPDIYDSAKEYLTNHDSYTFWSTKLPKCMLDTGGPTGVNVMDIYCLLQG